MNKILWKLDRISEKIWLIASSMAMEASKWGADGRGFAVVADETRSAALKISSSVEKALFDDESINQIYLTNIATELNFLALNAAIESNRGSYKGKNMAICAEDVRNLATEIVGLLDDKKYWEHNPPPFPSNKMTSVDSRICFMQFTVNGYCLVENLNYIQELVTNKIDRDKTHIKLRGTSIPIVDCISMLGGKSDNAVYIILRTPWAKTNATYAVAVDEMSINSLFYCPIGVPVPPAPDTKLLEYVRECWDSTDGEQFRFMDWTKMI